MAFLPLLLLGTIWTCKAFGPEKYLSQWPQEAAELENHSWEEGSQLTHAQYHDDFNYASQFSNPHHASSTTTPYPFNSYDQVDSSSWEIPGNLGFNQYGHNTPADHWYLTQADASSWANLPSDSYPIATEAHGAPEHETSAPTVWQKLLASANGHDWQSHLDPVSNVPESNHDPTGSMILEAPAHYSSNSLELHTPASASSLGPATSFGLPIEWFTKDFLQEVAQPTEASELNQDTAPGATKGATEGANIGSYYKLESHMRSFEGGLAVVLRDDGELYEWSKSYSRKKVKTKDVSAVKGRRTGYFLENQQIWLDYWKAQTGIDLQTYVDQIESERFKPIFPLFLFYIELLTLILPRTQMEGLSVRCQWFVNVANTEPIHRRPHPQKDPKMYRLALSLSQKKTRNSMERNSAAWVFIFAWAREYRPRILPKEMIQDPSKTSSRIQFLGNALFSCSVVKLTEECQKIISNSKNL